MKKSLVAALTTALVVGAASTTFAAVNPFTDVPADHWAYDAVTQLAADGVIEGYGDDTFRGQQEITRYEMAQMIAKAMARTDVSATDRALIDRLAAEFADELNNLGVRVANLERNADMVKWNGKIEYTYTSDRVSPECEKSTKLNHDHELFRLEPSAEVNNHWHVNARLDAYNEMDSDSGVNKEAGDEDDYTVKLKRVYAEGDYDNFNIKLGKQELYTNEGAGQLGGLLFDDEFSGAAVTFGNDLQATLLAGRIDAADIADGDDAANFQGINLQYAPSKFSIGAGYYHLNTENLAGDWSDYSGAYSNDPTADDANIWSVNLGYDFGSSQIIGAYAQNTEVDDEDSSWQVEYDYKGADQENKGTWGAWVGYRSLSENVSLMGTADYIQLGTKGWTVGANYTLMKNIVLTARYADGKSLKGDKDVDQLFGRVEFFF